MINLGIGKLGNILKNWIYYLIFLKKLIVFLIIVYIIVIFYWS